MNILQVVNSGNPGGVEQHILDLISGLNKKGHTCFVSCKQGEIVNWYKEAGASIYIEYPKFEIDPIYISKLISIIKQNKINVVHAHELKAGVNAMIAATIAQVPVTITHIHTPISEWQTPNLLKKVYSKIESIFYNFMVSALSDYEIALTESRKRVKMSEGLNENRIKVIPNGIDISLFDISKEQKNIYRTEIREKYKIESDAIIIGNTGRHTEEKGLETLIRAFAFINSASKKNLVLMLAGGGRLEEDYKKLAKELGVWDKTIFTGVFAQEEKPKYYCAYDVFVFPSLAEGFGLVLLEAMAIGLPTISSDLPVLQEVGGNEVKYFKTADSKNLAYTLNTYLNFSAEELTAKGLACRNRVLENFTLDKFVSNYIKLYESIDAGKTRSS